VVLVKLQIKTPTVIWVTSSDTMELIGLGLVELLNRLRPEIMVVLEGLVQEVKHSPLLIPTTNCGSLVVTDLIVAIPS
jgi:hypothetical protein